MRCMHSSHDKANYNPNKKGYNMSARNDEWIKESSGKYLYKEYTIQQKSSRQWCVSDKDNVVVFIGRSLSACKEFLKLNNP